MQLQAQESQHKPESFVQQLLNVQSQPPFPRPGLFKVFSFVTGAVPLPAAEQPVRNSGKLNNELIGNQLINNR